MTVQPYLRIVAAQGRETEVVGPFIAYFNPANAGEGSNYAIPTDNAEPTADDVAALQAAFRARERRPRLEFLPASAPAAERALLAAGFETELRTTVMVCEPGDEQAPATRGAVSLSELGPGAGDAELRELVAVQCAAFGDELTQERVEMARRWLGRWSTVLARVGDEAAGAGMSLDVHDGATELVGIATAERFRGRGVAAAVVAELVRLVRARGADTVFLTPGDAGAERVYARAGFRAVEEMLHVRAV